MAVGGCREDVIEDITHGDAGCGNCVREFTNPAEEASIDEFVNVVATETLALFEYLGFEFRREFDVFVPSKRGRTRNYRPPERFRPFRRRYHHSIYGIRPVLVNSGTRSSG